MASFGYNDDEMVWENINIHVGQGECPVHTWAQRLRKNNAVQLYQRQLCACIRFRIHQRKEHQGVFHYRAGTYHPASYFRNTVRRFHIHPWKWCAWAEHRILACSENRRRRIRTGLTELWRTWASPIYHPRAIHIYPGGERQLVLIARTLCQDPEIVLLDEPTSHLDFKNQALILQIIKKLSRLGMTIIMTSHYPNHVWKVGTHVAMPGR